MKGFTIHIGNSKLSLDINIQLKISKHKGKKIIGIIVYESPKLATTIISNLNFSITRSSINIHLRDFN